jgi:fibronectin type 3 domain-containing protein
VSQKEGRPRVLGEAGPAAGLFYPDIYPPAAPGDLVCLPEGTRVRLRWRTVDQAESYRVYRATDGADTTLLEEGFASSQYEDLAPPPGTSVYEVTAVDAAGNESAASSCTAARGAES